MTAKSASGEAGQGARPVARSKSRIASSMTRVTRRVAAGVTLPVEVLMKSAPAAMARTLAQGGL